MKEKYHELLQVFENGEFLSFIKLVENIDALPEQDSAFLMGYVAAAYNNLEEYEKALTILNEVFGKEKTKNFMTYYRAAYSFYFMSLNQENPEYVMKATNLILQAKDLEPDCDFVEELAFTILLNSWPYNETLLMPLMELAPTILKRNPEYHYAMAKVYHYLYEEQKNLKNFLAAMDHYSAHKDHFPEDKEAIDKAIELLNNSFQENNKSNEC